MARRDLTQAPLVRAALADPTAERVRQSHERAIRQLQENLALTVIRNVQLPNGTEVPIHHGLGRPPAIVLPGAVRATGAITAGVIVHYATTPPSGRAFDPTQQIVLVATGFGTTVTVDVGVA